MILGQYAYVPLLRTREAELKGLEHVSADALNMCLPVLELTRSRRTKKSPQGDIERNLDRIADILGDRRFILDVTVEDEYSNSQTERLLDPSDGFANWCDFVSARSADNWIPMVHLAEGMDSGALSQEVSRLAEAGGPLAVRLDYTDSEIANIVQTIYGALGDPQRLIVLLDAGFIRAGSEADHDDLMIDAARSVSQQASPAAIVTLASSFPSNVKDTGYGGDARGDFPMSEVLLGRLVTNELPDLPIYYGDYGSIHPIRYPAAFGTWVPRIDVPLYEQYFYHRCRRNEGGYERAAQLVLEDDLYESAKAWGDEQIEAAAQGEPEGRNPAHWIAVRVNIHLTRQATRQLFE